MKLSQNTLKTAQASHKVSISVLKSYLYLYRTVIMWKVLQKLPAYFIKFYQENDEFTVSITNYMNIWTSILSNKSFLHILQESNEDMQFDDDSILLDKGINMLSHPEELKNVSIEEKDSNLSVLFTKSYGYVLWLNLDLVLGSNKCMFKEVIQPLLKTVNDLRASQSELREELKKKDKEIEEYKCEGGEIALRHLKTEVFNDAAHMSKHRKYEKYFGNVGVLEELLQPVVIDPDVRIKSEYHSIPNHSTTVVKQEIQQAIKSENTAIKTEPSSQDATAENSTAITTSNQTIDIEKSVTKSEPSNHGNRSDNSIANSPNSDIKSKLEATPRKRPRNKLNL